MLIIQPALNLHPSTPRRSLPGKYAWCPISILSTCTAASHQKQHLHQNLQTTSRGKGIADPTLGWGLQQETPKIGLWLLIVSSRGGKLKLNSGGFMWLGDYKNKLKKNCKEAVFLLFFFWLIALTMAAMKRIFLRTNGSELHRSSLHMWKSKESKGTRCKCQHNTRQQLARNIFNPQTACKGLVYNFPSINFGPIQAFLGAHEL